MSTLGAYNMKIIVWGGVIEMLEIEVIAPAVEQASVIYCLIVAENGLGMDFCLKGVEQAGKTRLAIAEDLEEIARRLRFTVPTG